MAAFYFCPVQDEATAFLTAFPHIPSAFQSPLNRIGPQRVFHPLTLNGTNCSGKAFKSR